MMFKRFYEIPACDRRTDILRCQTARRWIRKEQTLRAIILLI